MVLTNITATFWRKMVTMIRTLEDLQEALALIKLHESDYSTVEAKTMSMYSRKALGPTLSAFANLSGGGTILLGVDESADNPLVGVDNPGDYIQRITDQARKGFSSPIQVDPIAITVDEITIVAVNVKEAAANDKPCRWNETGKAYIRQFDGDYAMSPQEEEQLIRRHVRPREDGIAVPGTSIDDLDAELLNGFLTNVRSDSSALATASDSDILLNLNVTTPHGELTRGGLYALGRYPQRFFPTLMLTAHIVPRRGQSDTRALNRRDFTGPLPRILADATRWVADNTPTAITVDVIGNEAHGGSSYTFPPDAVREAIANALVHRDLSDAALGRAVELKISDAGLILTNPGGLWGLTRDQLGTGDGKSAVNEHLYTICRYVHGPHGRIIEALGSGIRTMRNSLREAGLQPPYFFDNSVRFTVKFPRSAAHPTEDLVWLSTIGADSLNHHQKEALLDMRRGTSFSNATYRKRFGVDSTQARNDLQELVKRNLAEISGQRRGTRYHLPDALRTQN